jgi:hypothetical protein
MTTALQQMLPYHLVPQREATMVQQQQQLQPFHQQHKQQLLHPPSRGVQDRRYLDTLESGDYTDSSLQYADESEFEESALSGGGGDGSSPQRARKGQEDDDESNANSASYGSRNQSSTLPLQQQQQFYPKT